MKSLPQPSPLDAQLAAQTQDLDWTLAHFPFVANITTLAAECDVAHSPTMSVASCRNLPQPVLSFLGSSADLLANYATFLADPGSEMTLTVNEEQLQVAQEAFEVLEVHPLWQMVRCDPLDWSPRIPPRRLGPGDWSAMKSLARAEKVALEAFTKDPFAQGPAFGVWEKRRLQAMGMTLIRLPRAAHIGNVLVRRECEGQDHDLTVIAALTNALLAEDCCAFLMLPQAEEAASRRLEHLGFQKARLMYRIRCVLREELHGPAHSNAL